MWSPVSNLHDRRFSVKVFWTVYLDAQFLGRFALSLERKDGCERGNNCGSNDTHIQVEAAIIYIEHIPFITVSYVKETVGLSPVSLYLGHTRDTWLYKIAVVVIFNYG